jgi:hypothetical protein
MRYEAEIFAKFAHLGYISAHGWGRRVSEVEEAAFKMVGYNVCHLTYRHIRPADPTMAVVSATDPTSLRSLSRQ